MQKRLRTIIIIALIGVTGPVFAPLSAQGQTSWDFLVLKPLAEQGDAKAQFAIGAMYDEGMPSSVSSSTTVHPFLRATSRSSSS
jgi:hypothetical protein